MFFFILSSFLSLLEEMGPFPLISLLPFQSRLLNLKGKQRSLRPHLRCSPLVTDGETEATRGTGCSTGRTSLHLSLPPPQTALHPNPTLRGQGPAASALAIPSPLPLLRRKAFRGCSDAPRTFGSGAGPTEQVSASFLTFPLDRTPWQVPEKTGHRGTAGTGNSAKHGGW